VKGGGPQQRQDEDDDGLSLPRSTEAADSRCALRSATIARTAFEPTDRPRRRTAPPRRLTEGLLGRVRLTCKVVSPTLAFHASASSAKPAVARTGSANARVEAGEPNLRE
jgi:hypothetical protein